MHGELTAEFHVGPERRARAWRLYLPTGSQATGCFLEPLTLVLKETTHDEAPPECAASLMKVVIGDTPAWQGTRDITCAFGCLWVEVLQAITELTPRSVSLVFFSGLATHEDVFSLWPHLPFGEYDDIRFYVSEVRKDSRVDVAARVWLSVEYAYESFKRLVGLDGYEHSCGTTIMGMSIAEGSATEYLSRDPLDRSTLERSLESQDVRCWWVCDADFDGMTIWHKDYEGDELAKRLERVVRAKE